MVNIFAKKGIHMYNRNKLYLMSVLTLGTYSYIYRKRILAFCPQKCRSRRPKMGTALQDLCQLQGCQIFLGTWYQNRKKCTKRIQNVPNGRKISRVSLKCSKWPKNICNHFPIWSPPKCTQIGVFCLKTNHLATLVSWLAVHSYKALHASNMWHACSKLLFSKYIMTQLLLMQNEFYKHTPTW
jgi:hypothetical protein